jgi:hypothetical protein
LFFRCAMEKGSHVAAFFVRRALYFPAWTTKKSARAGEAPRGRENPFEGSIRRNGFGPGFTHERIGVFSPHPWRGLRHHVRGNSSHAPIGLSWCSGSASSDLLVRKIGILPSKLFRLSSASPYFSMLYGWGHFTPALRCVNALWGKLLGMAVTKCIVLQVVESPASKKPAF